MPTDVEHLGKWFASVTKPQLARYNRRMADAAAYRNSPRWARLREVASLEFEATTLEARNLYEMAIADMEVFGEISAEVDFALTQFKVGEIFAVAAE